MAFLDQNPPSFDNQLEYDKWVAEQLKAADADQERQDKELEEGYVTQEEFEKDQERQDDQISEIILDINKGEDPDDGSTSYRFVTHPELTESQAEQDAEWGKDQKRQDDELEAEIAARVERDQLHDAQLNTIEYKLDQLVGLTFKGTYEFKHEADCDAIYQQCIADCWDNDPDDHNCRTECGREMSSCETDKVRAGYFEAVDPDDQFDHLEQIIISKSDVDGVELDWSGYLDAGDYLEVDHSLKGELDKRNYGLYRITEEPEHTQNNVGEDVYVIKLQFLQGDGVLAEGEVYEIRGITAAEGVSPEELADFLTRDEAANLYALKNHSHPWGEITGKPSSYPPSSHTHSQYIANNTTADQSLSGNLTGQYFYGKSSSNNSGFMTRQKILEAIEANGGGSVSDTDFVKNGNSSAITITKTSGVYYISGG